MPNITDSVGEGGSNRKHDAGAIVQLMLHLIKDATNKPFFAAEYNGNYAGTKAAIVAFQNTQKLLPTAPSKPGLVTSTVEKEGLIGKTSQTLAKMVAVLPAAYKDIRIIENTTTVYLPMDKATADSSGSNIGGKTDLDPTFRGKVKQLVDKMYADHQIALRVTPSGWRRDFAEQASLSTAVTGAGPGESNHQYGKAVDIGFEGLRWVAGDGSIKTDNYWLSSQGMTAAKAAEFWNARNAIAFKQLGLFPTAKDGDLIHVQAYSDTSVSYGRSLAALLNAVLANGFRWEAVVSSPNHYKCDFGLAGKTYDVGTARQIWAGSAPVVKSDLCAALNAKVAADKNFDVKKYLGLPAAPFPSPKPVAPSAAKPTGPAVKETDIPAAFVQKIQKDLKANFEAADKGWSRWKALP